jgi:hypothetical protein
MPGDPTNSGQITVDAKENFLCVIGEEVEWKTSLGLPVVSSYDPPSPVVRVKVHYHVIGESRTSRLKTTSE